jgi:hypothetical protein
MLAGLCAGVVEAVVAVTPSETIKCVSTLPSEGSLHSVRTKLIQVYRGLTPTVRMRWDMGMAM